ncbi:MAG: hypothetical protein ACJA0S_001222 [Rickettsiales bacterium]
MNLDLNTNSTTSSDAGDYDILASGASATNYDITYDNGELTINKAALTITADDKTKIYGNANPQLTYSYLESQLVNSDSIEDSISSPILLTTDATTTSPISSDDVMHKIIASNGESKNYNLTYQAGVLTIEPKPNNNPETPSFINSNTELQYQPLAKNNSSTGCLIKVDGNSSEFNNLIKSVSGGSAC